VENSALELNAVQRNQLFGGCSGAGLKSIRVREPVWTFSISINSGCLIPFFFSMDFRSNTFSSLFLAS